MAADPSRLKRLGLTVLGMLSGGLTGYVVGWILGWSLFDPNMDVWALAAALGAIVGVGLGLRRRFWDEAGIYLWGTAGIYLGWLLRTLLFGDVPGGLGFGLVLVGLACGCILGARPRWRRPSPLFFSSVLYGSFFGGFLLGVGLGLHLDAEIVGFAPPVVGSGVLFGSLATVYERRRLRSQSAHSAAGVSQ